MSTPATPTRRSDFDFLRVIAMLAVVAIHCVMPIIMLKLPSDDNWIGADIIDNYLRWCVPVFVMLSGALLIKPQTWTSMRDFFRRRTLRVLVPLVAWALLYWLWAVVVLQSDVAADMFLRAFIAGTPVGGPQLYFLFIIIGLYALAPCISLYAGSVSAKTFRRTSLTLLALASAWLILQVQILGRSEDYNIFTWALPFIGYFMLGYSLRDVRTHRRQHIALLAGFILLGLLNVIASVFTRYEGNMFYQNYLSPTIIGLSICVFLGGRALYGRLRTERLDRLFGSLAKVSFGVYLVHVMILETLVRWLSLDQGRLDTAGLLFLLVTPLSLFVVVLLSLIPGVRRVFG